jgi:hypothetical protein
MSFVRTKAFALSLLATLALAGTAVANANPILNGNFSGSVSGYAYDPSNVAGWTFSGGAGVQQNGSAWGFTNAPGGSGQSAFLQSYMGPINVPTGNPSTISQTVSGLTVGDSYQVSFYLEARPGYGLDPVTVTIDGTTVTITPTSDSSWTKYTEYFTDSAGDSNTLTFSVSGSGVGNYDNDTGLADVSLAGVPEPGTLLLLGSGLLAFAGFARRKFGTRNL